MTTPRPIRLSPDAAGQLQYDHERAAAELRRLRTINANLLRLVSAAHGQPAARLILRQAERDALLAELEQELATA